ncbi:ATP-binding cassette sub-family C member 5-like [Ptychodera flava]|uniref:ATP-binding cassette sub-family C member 5-like n=1 Tax=Ptychodera flava TaxID=63121 RepID=UPI00396A22ED
MDKSKESGCQADFTEDWDGEIGFKSPPPTEAWSNGHSKPPVKEEKPPYVKKGFFERYKSSLRMFIPIRFKKTHRCPIDDAGFLNILWVNWITPLIVKARKENLEVDDIWPISELDEAEVQFERLDRIWREEVRKKKGVKEASLGAAMFKFVRTRATLGSLMLTLAFYLGCLGDAVMLSLILYYVETLEKDWLTALILCLGILFTELFRAMGIGYAWFLNYRTGARLRGASLYLVFEKLTRLRNLADQSIGQFVNLVANDGQRIFDVCQFAPFIVGGPLLAIGVIALATVYMGLWGLIGSLVILLFYPVQFGLAKVMTYYRKKAIDVTDLRVRKMNEMIMCVKLIKMYAWELSFSKAIASIRDNERGYLTWAAFISSVNLTVSPFVCIVAAVVANTGYILSGNEASTSVSFTIVTLYNAMRYCINSTPFAVRGLSECGVAIRRMKIIMEMTDYEPCTRKPSSEKNAIEIKDGTFAWEKQEDIDDEEAVKAVGKKKRDDIQNYEIVLRDINFTLPKGSLVGICGSVGSGKSSLVSAIISQMECVKGSLAIDGTFALATQQAWIQNGTLKDNIVFGMPYDEKRYQTAIEACCLKPDLAILPNGDQTEIGERGLNVSGGQKQRISLARAFYCNRSIVLLDDPLSAVDAHVGKHLFKQLIRGALRGKSIVFVTHQLQFLSQCDEILVMKDGMICERGKHADMMEKGGEYAFLIKTHYSDEEEKPATEVPAEIIEDTPLHRNSSASRHRSSTSGSRRRTGSRATKSSMAHDVQSDPIEFEENKEEAGQLTQKEDAGLGTVGISVYAKYFKFAGGYCVMGWTMMLFIVVILLQTFNSVWLSVWLEYGSKNNTVIDDDTGEEYYCTEPHCQDSVLGFAYIYIMSVVFLVIIAIIKSYAYVTATLRASTNMHDVVFVRVFRCPMKFFDTTPSGRIINRFSKDLDEMDSRAAFMAENMVQTFLGIFFSLIMIGVIFPFFFLCLIPLMAVFVVIYLYFRVSVRVLKRLDNVTRSPWFSHISAAAQGVASIHAFEKEREFNLKFQELMDNNTMPYMMFTMGMRWASIRLDIVTLCITVLTAMFVCATHGQLPPSYAGLALSFAVQNAGLYQAMVRLMAEVEARFTSAERMIQYIDELYDEAPAIISDKRPEKSWPKEGKVKFINFKMRYRENLPLVLRGVNLDIKAQEKVGIVGRTGSGKSSLGVGLFRLVEPAGGHIEIDGINCHEIGLFDLRSKLSIIPQDPVLFLGTVRYNLDPFGVYSDEQIWHSLEKCYMKDSIMTLDGGLEAPVVENGENFSVGERQLMCMARALLRNSKILMLDEATAAIDTETDSLIQTTIREAFKHCTMLTIAHRLNTVLTCDRILVMSDGLVAEFDTPAALIAKPNGIFAGMLKAAESSKRMVTS